VLYIGCCKILTQKEEFLINIIEVDPDLNFG
jgi:hypothetical protein